MSQQRDEIPAELLEFLHNCIDSVECLQVLLLLAEPSDTPWTIESLSVELRSSKASVQKRVQDLLRNQVLLPESLAADGVLHFLPFTPRVEHLVREMAELYRQRPHRVIAQIFARPHASLQSFADAFKLKKDEH